MEVFIGSPNYADFGELGVFRKKVRALVVYAWQRIPGVRLYAYRATPDERWTVAEALATEPIYALADDDCLPPHNLSFDDVVNAFDNHPSFGALGIGNPNIDMGMFSDASIIEVNSIGGIRFLRKGVVNSWPKNFTGDDNQYAGLMSAKGFRSAYLKRYGLLHLGDGYSVWQKIRDGVTA